MRRSALSLGSALFAAIVGAADSRATTIDYQGYAFETGGFPASDAGDTLRIPIVATAASLGIDLATHEVTGWIHGLVSGGTVDVGDGILMTTYGTGRIEIYRDASRDRDFGEFPPNLTAPSTFVNGELCLAGELTDFVLFFDPESQSGAYEGNVDFTTGACLAELGAGSARGFTFGGVVTPAVSGSVPPGYDLSVDGYLEAQKKPTTACPFACIELTGARLEFPRVPPRHFGPKDGKFRIDGVFTPCPEFGVLDPSQVEIRVRIGTYEQILPEGSMVLEEDDDDADVEWEFKNSRGVATLTEVEIELEADGAWEFELFGRGIPRATLLGDDPRLEVELTIGTMNGTAQATLVQKKNRLRFRGDDRPCPVPQAPAPQGLGQLLAATAPAPRLLPAAPNPFNPTTTIGLRTVEPGFASIGIFDVAGRLVRLLQRGDLPAGEHRFVWNGEDDRGRRVASGVFLYRVEAPGIAETRKMVLAK